MRHKIKSQDELKHSPYLYIMCDIEVDNTYKNYIDTWEFDNDITVKIHGLSYMNFDTKNYSTSFIFVNCKFVNIEAGIVQKCVGCNYIIEKCYRCQYSQFNAEENTPKMALCRKCSP